MKINVLGIPFNAEKKEDLLKEIFKRLDEGKKTFIVTPYSESIVEAQNNQYYREILNSADIALPDGMGILWAANFQNLKTKNHKSRFKALKNLFHLLKSLLAIVFSPDTIKNPIPEKISGSEIVWDLCALASQKNQSVFFLGGWNGTGKKAADKLLQKFPALRIAGTYEGSPGEEGIVEQVNAAKPDLLLVAYGPVRQEKWIAENLDRLQIKLAIGLGGTFDYLASAVAPAPRPIATKGLEWLWRLFTQPWRIKRIFRGVFGLIYYVLTKS